MDFAGNIRHLSCHFSVLPCRSLSSASGRSVINDISTDLNSTFFLQVLIAFGICAFLVACLCLFARFAPCDFTSCYTLIFILILALLVLGILAIFIRGLWIVYICLGVIAYSIFIVYDLQLIIGGKIHKNQYDELDYIIASMILFHDVVHLFMFILQLAGWIDDD